MGLCFPATITGSPLYHILSGRDQPRQHRCQNLGGCSGALGWAFGHPPLPQSLGTSQPTRVWVTCSGPSSLLWELPRSEFPPAAEEDEQAAVEGRSREAKEEGRLARGGPWFMVPVSGSGFITVLNGMTVSHDKSVPLLPKSQTIKALAVKVIHHHKDLRRSSHQFHSHP